jgi:hypothetical protein
LFTANRRPSDPRLNVFPRKPYSFLFKLEGTFGFHN